MKKILIVAYLFPPTATTGVHRVAKFVKYLGEFGWQVTVLTTANTASIVQDNSLCTDFPDDLRIIKISSFERSRVQNYVDRFLYFLKLRDYIGDSISWRLERLYKKKEIPDQHALWAIKASARAEKLLKCEHFDALLTTSWPYSDHLVGLSVVKKIDLPWIADFRDPWIANTNYQQPKESVLGRKERYLENEFVCKSSAVLGVTADMVDTFRQRYPQIDREHFKLVRNGYDQNDLPSINSPVENGPLTIAFVGSFYRDRSPLVMIKALQRLSSKGITATNVQVKFVGGMGGYDQLFKEYLVESYCHVYGYQPAKECYQLIEDCHALWFQSTENDNFAVPGKIYEYLAMHKVIIASAPKQTETMGILQEAGGVFQVEPEDDERLAEIMCDLLARKNDRGLSFERDSRYVEQFSRRAQTQILAGILEEIS